MEIGDWSATPDLNEIYREIRTLGIETNLAELEAYGFTIIENALPVDVCVEMRDKIVALAEKRVGRKLDLENEQENLNTDQVPYVLFKDPIFKKSVLNPKPLALITYLLGKKCLLSSLRSFIKGPSSGSKGFQLHTDTGHGIPEPFPPYVQIASCNYALTPFAEELGGMAVVPGSHQAHRGTTRWERPLTGNDRYEHVIAIDAPVGAAVIWSHTWHGSFPRTVPGLRVNLSAMYCREYIQTQEVFSPNEIPEGYLTGGKDDERLKTLLGADLTTGWRDEGPSKVYQKVQSKRPPTWQS